MFAPTLVKMGRLYKPTIEPRPVRLIVLRLRQIAVAVQARQIPRFIRPLFTRHPQQHERERFRQNVPTTDGSREARLLNTPSCCRIHVPSLGARLSVPAM